MCTKVAAVKLPRTKHRECLFPRTMVSLASAAWPPPGREHGLRPVAFQGCCERYIQAPEVTGVLPWPAATMTIADRAALQEGLLLHRDVSFSRGFYPYAHNDAKRRAGHSRQDDMAASSFQHEQLLRPSSKGLARSASSSSNLQLESKLASSASAERLVKLEGLASTRPSSSGLPPTPTAEHERMGLGLYGHSSPVRPIGFSSSSSFSTLPKVAPWEAKLKAAYPETTRRSIKETSLDIQRERSKQRWAEMKAERDRSLAAKDFGVGGSAALGDDMWRPGRRNGMFHPKQPAPSPGIAIGRL